jgi:flagellar hook-associated protein 3 FlgL
MMALQRVNTSFIFNKTISEFGRVQSDIAKITQQISSGRKASVFSEMGADIRRIQNFETDLSRTQSLIDNNKIVISRLNVQQSALSDLEQIATDLRNFTVQERSVQANNVPLADLARNLLSSLQDALNRTSEGRFIFGGARVDTPPVENVETQTNLLDTTGAPLADTSLIFGTPSANYYRGDTEIAAVKATDQLTVNYGVTANQQPFQDLIGALNLAIRGEGLDSTIRKDEFMQETVRLATEALDGIVGLQNQTNNDLLTLEKSNDLHEGFKTFLNQSIGEEEGVDVAEASIQLAFNQTVLQASFQNFSRISSLSLLDFLR